MINKSNILTALAGYVFLNLYGFYVHGSLLAETYALMPVEIYRSESEFMDMFLWVTSAYALMAIAMVAIKGNNWGSWKCGMGFGFWIGLFVGAVNLINYAVYPWPFALAMGSFGADIGMGALTGAIMAFVHSKTKA